MQRFPCHAGEPRWGRLLVWTKEMVGQCMHLTQERYSPPHFRLVGSSGFKLEDIQQVQLMMCEFTLHLLLGTMLLTLAGAHTGEDPDRVLTKIGILGHLKEFFASALEGFCDKAGCCHHYKQVNVKLSGELQDAEHTVMLQFWWIVATMSALLMVAFICIKFWKTAKVLAVQLLSNRDDMARATLLANANQEREQKQAAEQRAINRDMGDSLRRARESLEICRSEKDKSQGREEMLEKELSSMFKRATAAENSLALTTLSLEETRRDLASVTRENADLQSQLSIMRGKLMEVEEKEDSGGTILSQVQIESTQLGLLNPRGICNKMLEPIGGDVHESEAQGAFGMLTFLQPTGALIEEGGIASDLKYALKTAKADEGSVRQGLNEVRVLKDLHHSGWEHNHTVRFLAGEEGSSDGSTPMLLMLMEEGTVADLIKASGGMTHRDLLRPLAGIANAVQMLHDHPLRILHRDIKPENILYRSGGGGERIFMLADFGLALSTAGEALPAAESSNLGAGTAEYAAPETMADARVLEGRARGYSLEGDLYSLAVVAMEGLLFQTPFGGDVLYGAGSTYLDMLKVDREDAKEIVAEAQEDLNMLGDVGSRVDLEKLPGTAQDVVEAQDVLNEAKGKLRLIIKEQQRINRKGMPSFLKASGQRAYERSASEKSLFEHEAMIEAKEMPREIFTEGFLKELCGVGVCQGAVEAAIMLLPGVDPMPSQRPGSGEALVTLFVSVALGCEVSGREDDAGEVKEDGEGLERKVEG